MIAANLTKAVENTLANRCRENTRTAWWKTAVTANAAARTAASRVNNEATDSEVNAARNAVTNARIEVMRRLH